MLGPSIDPEFPQHQSVSFAQRACKGGQQLQVMERVNDRQTACRTFWWMELVVLTGIGISKAVLRCFILVRIAKKEDLDAVW